MSGPARFFGLIILGAVLILANTIFFTVNEKQQAIVLQFGAPVGGAINEPGTSEAGLKIKLPWQNVVPFERRNLEFDLRNSQEIIVANEERLRVDAFVRYQIVDPLLYYQSLGGAGNNPVNMRNNFNNRLTNILSEAMREQLGARTISQIINVERARTMEAIQADVTDEARKLGVSIIDVRIRRADFPPENAEKVNERMRTDYYQQAERIRAEGEREAREIRATADKEVVRIRAQAEQSAQVIRGRADAVRNCIFANAYQGVPAQIEPVTDEALAEEAERVLQGGPVSDEAIAAMLGVTCRITGTANRTDGTREEFFAFYRSMTAYEEALKDEGTTIILSPDSEFFRYFNDIAGR